MPGFTVTRGLGPGATPTHLIARGFIPPVAEALRVLRGGRSAASRAVKDLIDTFKITAKLVELNGKVSLEDFEIEYYPNPTSNFVNFIYQGDLSISVYDILGRRIIETNEKFIDLSDYNKGLYLFKINDYYNQKFKLIRIIKK